MSADSRVVVKGFAEPDAHDFADVLREEFPELDVTVKTRKDGKK